MERDLGLVDGQGRSLFGAVSAIALQLILFFYILKFIHLQCILQCYL
ncbi:MULTISPECIES: hypothetical protein [unclassified Microcoleus]